jgi:hypothetical protein
MNWRNYLFLGILGLLVAGMVAQFQPAPDYPDADYYYAVGVRLADGKGLSEPFLWNYLDDPMGLPHASFSYWMPMASFLTAGSAALFGSAWPMARIVFLLIAALIPPLAAYMALAYSSRVELAWMAGLLAVATGYYVVYLPVSDTFGIYMLLGGSFLLAFRSSRIRMAYKPVILGLIAGCMHLTRADGILWLVISIVAAVLLAQQKGRHYFLAIIRNILLAFAGYLIIMGPWFIRNGLVFGSILAPGGIRTLWLTSYNQIFTYPADQLTFSAWWQSGIGAILKVRALALWINLQSTFAVQGEIFLFPLILAGIWHLRRDKSIQLALAAWLVTILTMSAIFPYAGVHGGYFHSGSAFQLLWWTLSAVGLTRLVAWFVRWRGRQDRIQAERVFQIAIVGFALLLTTIIAWNQIMGNAHGEQGWGTTSQRYQYVDWFLDTQGAKPEDVVMVANPPGYYLASGHPAIALPEGGSTPIFALAGQYHARYLILEPSKLTNDLMSIYQDPYSTPGIRYLGDVEAARVFVIQP